MLIQKSFKQPHKANLYLVSTPIGNLSDMTQRAIKTLQDVALIACEDTRVTKKLCTHFNILTPLMSYHEHNQREKSQLIIDPLESGDDVALVSDAGMPLISDPGDQLVTLATDAGFPVIPIPGANAALCALIASGLATQPFLFYGFLERQRSKKEKQLTDLKSLAATLIFYESPHRLKDTLYVMREILGNRKVVVARELTKIYEEFLRGTIDEIISTLNEIKGEVVLIVDGNSVDEALECWWDNLSLTEHVNVYIKEGLKTNAAIKQTAADLNLSRQEVYKEYHN